MGRLPALLAVAAAGALAGCGGGGGGGPHPQTVSPAVLTGAIRATQAAGYTLTVGGNVNVQGQGYPIRGGSRGGRVEIEVGPTRKTVDLQPARLIALLRGVRGVSRLGTAVVDGVRTTHYYVEVPTPARSRSQFGDAIPVDVWVDLRGRIRRVRVQLSTPDYEAIPQIDVRGVRGRPPR